MTQSSLTIDWFVKAYPEVSITYEQYHCCRYLERQGKRFCIDFGYGNAPSMVWNEFDMEDPLPEA